jgi:hypothetical protein
MVEQGVSAIPLLTNVDGSEAQPGASHDMDAAADAVGQSPPPSSASSALVARSRSRLTQQIVVEAEELLDILGPPMYNLDSDPKRRITSPGIAMGLAASAVGGTVLFVEASKMLVTNSCCRIEQTPSP